MPPFYFLTFAKVSVSVSKKFGLKKVSVSVSKTFGLEKKSRYRSRKHLVSKKSLGIGLENIWSRKKVSVSVSKILVSKKSLGIGLDEIFWSRHSVLGDRQYGVMFVLVVWFLGYDWKTSILGQIVHDLSKLIGQTPLPENYNHTLGGKISRCILTMRRGTYGTCELVQIISLFRQGLPHLPVPIYVKTGIICNCAKH